MSKYSVLLIIFRYTASEALDILLNDFEKFSEGTITLLPPCGGQQSDEDSGDEEGAEFHQLSRNQLIAESELEIDYGSYVESSIINHAEMEVVHQPRRSSRLNNSISSNTENSVADLSADLWADESSVDSVEVEVFKPNPEKHWLSGQVPPLPPTAWLNQDLTPISFSDPPEQIPFSINHCPTPFTIFNMFFDDVVINHLVDIQWSLVNFVDISNKILPPIRLGEMISFRELAL